MKKLVILLCLFVPSLLLGQTTSQGVPTYAEDSPHVSGQKGVEILCKRTNTAASSTSTDGDYGTCNTDADGKIWVNSTISSIAPGSNASFAPLDVTAYSSIGAGYASAVDLPDGTKVVLLDNQTNGDVMVSMDGGVTDTYHVKAGDVLTINLAAAGLVTTADVQIKDGTSASTSGSFYVYSYK